MIEPPPNPPQRKRVLVVEDDNVLRGRIARILKARGFFVETADDGKEAVRLMHELQPHLVITDIEMPNMDGWELVRQLRSDRRSCLVPVIFLTGRAAADDVLRGFRLGADDYLSKPVQPADLLGRVQEVLRKRADLARLIQPPAPRPQRDPQRRRRPPTRRPDLVGSLDQLGLSTLLTVLESGDRTGVIRLWRGAGPEKETGRVWIRDGKVIRASVTGPGICDDADAIYYLLSWSRGEFNFVSAEGQAGSTSEAPTRVLGSTHMLLLEGARRIDEVVKDNDQQTEALRRAFLHPPTEAA